MAEWFVAPDAETNPNVTVVALGTSGYGTTWLKAAKFSDIMGSGGIVTSKIGAGDTITFLGGEYPLASMSGGFQSIASGLANLIWRGRTTDNKPAFAVFVGTRTFPWPDAGNDAVGINLGESLVFKANSGGTGWTQEYLRFEHCQYPMSPKGSNSESMGTMTQSHCHSLNTLGGLYYTQSRTDGRMGIIQKDCRAHVMPKGNGRAWASTEAYDSVFDCALAYDRDSAHRTAASTPTAQHVFDNVPEVQETITPARAERCIIRNMQGGASQSNNGYQQGDGFTHEENAGFFTSIDTLGYGQGDRDIDLKCPSTVIRHTSWGSGYALSHHNDVAYMNAYQCVLHVGNRPVGSNTPNACVQAAGTMHLYQSALICNPSPAEAANNIYAFAQGNVSPSSWQASILGGIRRGVLSIVDCWGILTASAGANVTELTGFTQSSDTARVGMVPSLANSTSFTHKVRAVGTTGTAGAYSATATLTTTAPVGSADVAGPNPPTNLAATAVTGGTQVRVSWTPASADSGTQIQGTMFFLKMPGDSVGIPITPTVASSPVTFSGLLPATSYTLYAASYDSNMNVGSQTSGVAFTTSAGSPTATTPDAPASFAVNSTWVGHPSMAGYQWGAPANGQTAAYYEIATSAGTVVSRSFPIPNTDGDGNQMKAVMTKSNFDYITN